MNSGSATRHGGRTVRVGLLTVLLGLAACETYSPVGSLSPRLPSSGFDYAVATGAAPARSLAAIGERPRFRLSTGIEAGVGADSSGSLFAVEGEIPLGSKLTIAPRIMSYDYSWEDEFEFEDGEGTGIGAELRFYPREDRSGFYIGGGLGWFFDNSWEYTDVNFPSNNESGDKAAFTAYAGTGYMFRIGQRFVIGPTAALGSYISDSPESGPYAAIGIRFGVNF